MRFGFSLSRWRQIVAIYFLIATCVGGLSLIASPPLLAFYAFVSIALDVWYIRLALLEKVRNESGNLLWFATLCLQGPLLGTSAGCLYFSWFVPIVGGEELGATGIVFLIMTLIGIGLAVSCLE